MSWKNTKLKHGEVRMSKNYPISSLSFTLVILKVNFIVCYVYNRVVPSRLFQALG